MYIMTFGNDNGLYKIYIHQFFFIHKNFFGLDFPEKKIMQTLKMLEYVMSYRVLWNAGTLINRHMCS